VTRLVVPSSNVSGREIYISPIVPSAPWYWRYDGYGVGVLPLGLTNPFAVPVGFTGSLNIVSYGSTGTLYQFTPGEQPPTVIYRQNTSQTWQTLLPSYTPGNTYHLFGWNLDPATNLPPVVLTVFRCVITPTQAVVTYPGAVNIPSARTATIPSVLPTSKLAVGLSRLSML
jgi:hypothetical protein